MPLWTIGGARPETGEKPIFLPTTKLHFENVTCMLLPAQLAAFLLHGAGARRLAGAKLPACAAPAPAHAE
eukprot:COSAG05_NODE_2782_length_2643_cov_1.910055_1_plen_70_part_00